MIALFSVAYSAEWLPRQNTKISFVVCSGSASGQKLTVQNVCDSGGCCLEQLPQRALLLIVLLKH